MKKEKNIDMYGQCFCGSGKKYKFCCYGKTDMEIHNSHEAHMYMIKNKKQSEFCLHKDENCNGDIIKSHSIQNNKILSKLAVNNHVYVIGANMDKFGGTDLVKCGKNEATTSTCFCLHHDTQIFKCIELQNYQYTEEQNFKYAYRAFSKYYYDRISGLEGQRIMFAAKPNFSILNGLHERIKGLEISVAENEVIKETFNSALNNQEFDTIQTIVITLNYEIGFATAYVSPLSYDLEGNLISDVWSLEGRMRNIYVSIFPENGKSYVLISWLKEDGGAPLRRYREQFESIKNQEDVLTTVLNNMVACQSDNIVFSKKLLNKWGKDKTDFFLKEYMSSFLAWRGNNIGLSIEKNIKEFECKYNLFEVTE